jgi:hypothetical protein
MKQFDALWRALAAIVWIHLIVSLVHGGAHAGGHVLLSPVQSGFVFLVILAGPLIGLATAVRRLVLGCSIVALTLVASLAFGLLNHFVLGGADQVTHVDTAWRPLFASTAALLAVTEFVGSALATRIIRRSALLHGRGGPLVSPWR